MEYIKIDGNKYQVVKTLKSENQIYYYTLDLQNDNEVVIFGKNVLNEDEKPTKVDEREYPILINKFALK